MEPVQVHFHLRLDPEKGLFQLSVGLLNATEKAEFELSDAQVEGLLKMHQTASRTRTHCHLIEGDIAATIRILSNEKIVQSVRLMIRQRGKRIIVDFSTFQLAQLVEYQEMVWESYQKWKEKNERTS